MRAVYQKTLKYCTGSRYQNHQRTVIQMGKYVYLNKKIDEEILIDWYINSTDEDTIWTKKHIDELLEDFVLIPKSSLKAIEEKTINDIKKQSVKHGR